MATQAQIAANRRNALKSTGPKSKQGKEKSRGNAFRHGLYARDLVALGETDDGFIDYHHGLAETLRPQDAYETLLVRRLALASWRQDRLAKLEAALIDSAMRREARDRFDALSPLTRHEATLDRAVHRAMTMLDRYRAARRRGELPLAPARPDINFTERSQCADVRQPDAVAQNDADLSGEQANSPPAKADPSPKNAELSTERTGSKPIGGGPNAAEMRLARPVDMTQ